MLSPANQQYLDKIRVQLANMPVIVDQAPQQHTLAERFDSIIARLQALSEEESKPEAIRTFSQILYASIQRDMEYVLKEARITEYAARAECIVSMYSPTLPAEEADESQQQEIA